MLTAVAVVVVAPMAVLVGDGRVVPVLGLSATVRFVFYARARAFHRKTELFFPFLFVLKSTKHFSGYVSHLGRPYTSLAA